VTPDPKDGKPIKDASARRTKLAQDGICRICSNQATDAHHIVYGGGRGREDTPDNLLPLCHSCHMFYHQSTSNVRLTAKEVAYIYSKMGHTRGRSYMERRRYIYLGA